VLELSLPHEQNVVEEELESILGKDGLNLRTRCVDDYLLEEIGFGGDIKPKLALRFFRSEVGERHGVAGRLIE
jgi:hypothetical protein